jgi:Holliday junction resolvasome RuvABC endonuclease subunit
MASPDTRARRERAAEGATGPVAVKVGECCGEGVGASDFDESRLQRDCGGVRVLAIDAATVTGWATNCDRPDSGVAEFAVKRGSSPGMRYLLFRNWLTILVRRHTPEVIVYEQMGHFKSGQAAEVCMGLMTRVQEVAYAEGVECCAVSPCTLKKWATGKGTADKDRMLAEAETRAVSYGWRHPQDHNEGDAMLLCLYAEAGFPEPEVKARKKRGR